MARRRQCGCREAVLWAALWQTLLLHVAVAGSTPAKAAAPVVVAGPASRVEDARLFHIYYGQGFKVIKNTWDGKSYLLMQNTSKMATKTKYCTGRIKSFVIPIANYSVDTTASPVSFFEVSNAGASQIEIIVQENHLHKPIVRESVATFYYSTYIHNIIKQNLKSEREKQILCSAFTEFKRFLFRMLHLFEHSFIYLSTGVLLSCMQLLGVLESLKGITSLQLASQCLLQAYASGNVQLVNRTDAQKVSQFTTHFMGSTDEGRGCNFAAYVPSEEDTPLQRAEWIKYLGTFTNSEDRANEVYDAIKTNYLCLSKAAANLSTRFKPVVAWIEYAEGVWTFVKENYKLQYVTDAGAETVDATITDKRFNISDPEDMDNLHAILCTVDVVIDQTYASDPTEYKLSTFLENINVGRDSCFSFVTNQSIWRFDRRIGDSKTLDWFDGAISQPQLVLADLIEAFFQTGKYTTIYFRNLAKEEGVTEIGPEMCNRSISSPMEPTILPCQ